MKTKQLVCAMLTRRSIRAIALASLWTMWSAGNVFANHPVLVEGEKDFDGDGLTGIAEDLDNNTDRVFGTVAAALSALNGGASQNGRVTIVTSGRFAEQLVISGINGNVTVEAAPGVEANIDAVVAGARGAQFTNSNNNLRQEVPGIVVETADNRRVVLRNLVIRNWSEGITVLSNSHVTISHCRLEGNRDYGIHVLGNATATIDQSYVDGTGFRVGTATNNVPNPGNGIEFEESASGLVCNSTITGNFGAGLANSTARHKEGDVRSLTNCIFDNSPDLALKGKKRSKKED